MNTDHLMTHGYMKLLEFSSILSTASSLHVLCFIFSAFNICVRIIRETGEDLHFYNILGSTENVQTEVKKSACKFMHLYIFE